MPSNRTEKFKYRAFISYRHADNKQEGRKWATWLHQAIETYDVPDDLAGTKNSRGDEIPARIYPIFRDEEELPADANLENAIVRALDKTQFLIVLCSPRAVQSSYVADEIDYFKKLGRSDQIVAAIIDGEPNASWDKGKLSSGFSKEDECFPLPLQFRYSPEGERTDKRAEPIAADFRTNIDGRTQEGWTSPEAFRQALTKAGTMDSATIRDRVAAYEKQLHLMLLKVVAGILGVPLGDLTQRDKEYQLAQARQKARRLRQWLAGVAVLAAVAVGAGVVAYFQKQQADLQRTEAERQRAQAEINEQRAVTERDKALMNQSLFLMDQAEQQNKAGNHDAALLLALNALPGPYGGARPMPSIRKPLLTAGLMNALHSRLTVDGNLTMASLSADGKMAAVASRDGTTSVQDIETGTTVATLSDRRVDEVAFSPDGDLLAGSDGFRTISFWNTSDWGEPVANIPLQGKQTQKLVFSPDGTRIAALQSSESISVWSSPEGALLQQLAIPSGNMMEKVAFSPDGTFVMAVNWDNEAFVWRLGENAEPLRISPSAPAAALRYNHRMPAFSPGTMGDDTAIIYYQPDTGMQVLRAVDGTVINSVDKAHAFLSPKGNRVMALPAMGANGYTGENERIAKTPYLYLTDKNLSVPLSHFNAISYGLFSPNGEYLLTLPQLGNATLWSAETGQKLRTYHFGASDRPAFTADSRYILTQSTSDDRADIWSVETTWHPVIQERPPGFGNRHMSVQARRLVQATQTGPQATSDYRTRLYDLKEGHLVQEITPGCMPSHDKLSADGSVLFLYCREDKEALAYGTRDGALINRFTIRRMDRLSLSPDGKHLVSSAFSGLDLRSIATGETLASLEAPASEVLFSADGSGFYYTSYDDQVRYFGIDTMTDRLVTDQVEDADPTAINEPISQLVLLTEKRRTAVAIDSITGKEAWRFSSEKQIQEIATSPDGSRVATANSDGVIMVMRSDTGEPIHTIRADGYINSLFFSPTGAYLFANGSTVGVWTVATGDPYFVVPEGYRMSHAAFSADGSNLVVATYDYGIQWWPLAIDDPVIFARKHLPENRRCLSTTERQTYFLDPLTEAEQAARGCKP